MLNVNKLKICHLEVVENRSIWLGRVLAPTPENEEFEIFSKKIAKNFHKALRTGSSWWFNIIELLAPALGIIGVILGFFYSWWGGFLAFSCFRRWDTQVKNRTILLDIVALWT